MKANTSSWSVGQLADKAGVATHVLRHWEDVGLLQPVRDASGYRRYGPDDLVRVAVIQRSQIAGMSLPQIRALLDDDVDGRAEVLRAHLNDLAERERELQRSREMTEHALRCQAHDIVQCPRFAAMVSDVLDGRADGLEMAAWSE